MDISNQFNGFLNTSPLFHEALEIGQFDLKTLKLDSNFNKTLDLQIPLNIPLGKRLEYFFEHLINLSSNFEVLAKNIQIFQDNQTIGEIDFILKDIETGIYYHIEFVYKYYLYFEKNNELEGFIGPNLNDSLIKKLNKLKNKQFPIINHKKTKNILEKIKVKDIVQKTVFLGNIFLPKHKQYDFKIIKNSCVKGFYTSIFEFNENIDEYSDYEYFLPHRFDWVAKPSENETWISYEKILSEIQFFIDLKKSPLVFAKTKENRFFQFFITYYEII